MAKLLTPAQMTQKAKFGSLVSLENAQGVNVPTFKPEVTLHFAAIKRSMAQNYLLTGTDLEHTRVIAVRHNAKINETQHVYIDGVDYDVVTVSPDDDTGTLIRYDYVTLRQSKGMKSGAIG
ncbi:phage head closure protein [Lacticaseibacillus hulanensis]|uniref:phage head closure protein n=1 Tax=Lacticaseibacillus hulanensis TaxID=2493111 RepID=UPI000FDA67D7|nr:phage head closure protein [Lacticaseibacillus hulanensis]